MGLYSDSSMLFATLDDLLSMALPKVESRQGSDKASGILTAAVRPTRMHKTSAGQHCRLWYSTWGSLSCVDVGP